MLKKFSNNLTEENDGKNQTGYRNYNNNIYLTKNLFLKIHFIFLLYISIFLIILLYKLEKKNSLNKKKIKINKLIVLANIFLIKLKFIFLLFINSYFVFKLNFLFIILS